MNYDRHPRTMEEAFGPGHRGGIFEECQPMDKADKIAVFGCLFALAAFVLCYLMGWVPG